MIDYLVGASLLVFMLFFISVLIINFALWVVTGEDLGNGTND